MAEIDTMRKMLSVLRGQEIAVLADNVWDIPTLEESDAERICRHPVVSVLVITYNHEKYLRRALDGILFQIVDFEYEVVVGEDCSTDGTRQICQEYVSRFPDKVRLLYWHENLRKVKHPAGGNLRRSLCRCRGEYIALCEGDDYWISPHKLAKQVRAFRDHPSVGMCFTNAKLRVEPSGRYVDWGGGKSYAQGKHDSADFFNQYCFGSDRYKPLGPECFIMTASVMFKKELLLCAQKRFDPLRWNTLVSDKPLFLSLSLLGDVYYLPQQTVVYRVTQTGACGHGLHPLLLDSAIAKLYYAMAGSEIVKGGIPAGLLFDVIWFLEDIYKRKTPCIRWQGISDVVRRLLRDYKWDFHHVSLRRKIKLWHLLHFNDVRWFGFYPSTVKPVLRKMGIKIK